MTISEEFDAVMLDAYQKTGKEAGYWANYFLRSVRQDGGLATAKRMLSKKLKSPSEQKGLLTLIEAGRLDLSVENLVLQGRFQSLFTTEELAEAQSRLASVPGYARRRPVPVEEIHAEDLLGEQEFSEGAKHQVTVNAYERDPRAKTACIKRYGCSCQVCGIDFQEIYGNIGNGFIHVHHKKPLAGRRGDYKVNPTTDLAPVCPNCHAMLHSSNPPLGIDELQQLMADAKASKQ